MFSVPLSYPLLGRKSGLPVGRGKNTKKKEGMRLILKVFTNANNTLANDNSALHFHSSGMLDPVGTSSEEPIIKF